jgi:hypothetical protein
MLRRRKLALAVPGSLRTVNRRHRVAATNPTASPVSRAATSGATGSSSTSSTTMTATRSFILDTLGRKIRASAQLRRHRFHLTFGGTTGGSRFVDRILVAVPRAVEHQVVEFPLDLTGDLAAPFAGVESGQSFCHPRRQRMPNPLSKESKSWIFPGTCRRMARTRAISIQLGENGGRGQAPSPPWYRRGATHRDGV